MAAILGLSFFYHDSAAALVNGGKIVAAAAEERFNRIKHFADVPKKAIEFCLEEAGFRSINDVDAIVFYERPFLKAERLLESTVATWPKSSDLFSRFLPGHLRGKLDVRRHIERCFPGFRGEIFFSEHHLSHAALAFYSSPYQDAAILTMDGAGEWETTTIGHGKEGKIDLRQAIHFPHSIGLFYAALTEYLGFEINEGEWKVMGLAAYGKPRFLEGLRKMVRMREDGSFALDMSYFRFHNSANAMADFTRWKSLLGVEARGANQPWRQEHADLASSGQFLTEELILGLARAARRLTGSKNLVLSGGVALNGLANYRIERDGIFDNVWIPPAPGDDGAALGAALLTSAGVYGESVSADLRNALLGPRISQEELKFHFSINGIPAQTFTPEELVHRTAALLGEGKVIGWLQDRMEFGPRALGARSILANAADPRMKEILNEKIKFRESFRPFAPVVPLEYAHEFFDIPQGMEFPFMNKIVTVRPEARAKIPAATHVDGTSRIQTVRKDTHPLLHSLLLAVKAVTGVPVLINTSFNIMGEPIVCGIADAYTCFQKSGLDALVAGGYLISEKSAKADENSVLTFYGHLPFNSNSSAVDLAAEISRRNPLKEYRSLHHSLRNGRDLSVLDVGCGTGWFGAAVSRHYGHTVTGIDFNPIAVRSARSLSRFVANADRNVHLTADIFGFVPQSGFDVVNSLGVAHHTGDTAAAVRRMADWIKSGGHLHLGLYHRAGRKPFLDYFDRLKSEGASEEELLSEFQRLHPTMTDERQLRSWFRDQVQHPQESLHDFTEVRDLLESVGLEVLTTSLNSYSRIPESIAEIAGLENEFARRSAEAIKRGIYSPGFFTVWARKGFDA